MADFAMDNLRARIGERLQENVVLANYTTVHIGGPADAFLPANSLDELARACQAAWELDVPFTIFGSGSNVLVSDRGYRGLVILNRARNIKIDMHHTPPTLWAESGANLGAAARQATLRGLSGLEWAATIPGTIGGAVYGNAGARGSDTHANLVLVEILHRDNGRETWPVERLAYAYRSSSLKREHIPAVILAARLQLQPGAAEDIQAKMDAFADHRRRTQPPGASMGSMFKNPEGDYAGRLIEAAGLKGRQAGGARISPLHANFFINSGKATAQDMNALITEAQKAVEKRFGIQLELEIELMGDWSVNGR